MAACAKYLVAVVDDDRRLLESLGSLLESAGYLVRLYSSPEELLKYSRGIAELDCLVSDIGMPVMDGFEFLRIAKAEKPTLPVIFITGRDDLAMQARAHSERSDGLFRKPFNGPDLLAAVHKAVAASSRR